MAALALTLAGGRYAAAQESSFQARLEGDEVIDLAGRAPLVLFPSMFSVYLQAEAGRCAIHLSGYKDIPTGTFPVVSQDSLNVRTLCILEHANPRERLLAETGTLTVTERTARGLNGKFDMVVAGGITGKKYRFTGTFVAAVSDDF